MNVWPVFIALGRLGVIWISNHQKRKIFLTIVTVSFLMYHLHKEREKQQHNKKLSEYGAK